MNLVADIGNTHTKIALFHNGYIVEKLTVGSDDHNEAAEWTRTKDFSKAIICRVGKIDNNIIYTINRICGNVLNLDHFTPLPVIVKYGTPASLGYDRIAAASGAYKYFKGKDVLVIDAGTAITIDFLNASGEYFGGNISPGLKSRFRCLHEYTAGLPLEEKDADVLLFGNDTRTAIVAGVQRGIVYELSGYVEDFSKEYPGCVVAVTGGDAEFLLPLLKKEVILYPDLVLEGLNFILDYNF